MGAVSEVRVEAYVLCVGVSASWLEELWVSEYGAFVREMLPAKLAGLTNATLEDVALAIIDTRALAVEQRSIVADFCMTGVPVLLLGEQRIPLQGALSYVDRAGELLDFQGLKNKIEHWVGFASQRRRLQQQEAEAGDVGHGYLHVDLYRACAELAQKIASRDRFMSVFSHELRGPLNGLILDAQLRRFQLSKGNLKAFTPERLEALFERDEAQILRLIGLVENLLDVSRMLAGAVSIEPQACDLSELVRQILSRLDEVGLQGEIDVVQESAGVGCWDPARVTQIITHLLRNALCYGAEKPVLLKIWSDDVSAFLSIEDQGQGIAEADQVRIFEPFERINESHFISGLGLGLYVARKLAQAHGGDVELCSVLDRGTTVILRLPI